MTAILTVFPSFEVKKVNHYKKVEKGEFINGIFILFCENKTSSMEKGKMVSEKGKIFRWMGIVILGLICIIGIGFFSPSLWLNGLTSIDRELLIRQIVKKQMPELPDSAVMPAYDKHLAHLIERSLALYTGENNVRAVVRTEMGIRHEKAVNREILPESGVIREEYTEQKEDSTIVQNKVYDYSTRTTTVNATHYDIKKLNILIFIAPPIKDNPIEFHTNEDNKAYDLIRETIGFEEARGDNFQIVHMPRYIAQSGVFGVYDTQIRQVLAIMLMCILGILVLSEIIIPLIMRCWCRPCSLAIVEREKTRDSYRHQIVGNLEENLSFKARELCRQMPEAAINILRNWMVQETKDVKTNDVFSPAQKAAIVLLCIGEQSIRQLFKNMTEAEVYSLSRLMASLGQVKAIEIQPILFAFCQLMTAPQDIRQTKPLVENLIRKTLPIDKADALLQEMKIASTGKTVWEKMATVPAKNLSAFLTGEYPQTAAVILYHLSTEKAAEVLMETDDKTGAQILIRLSALQYMTPEKVRSIEIGLEKQIEQLMEKPRDIGERKASAILSLLDKKTQSRYMTSMKQYAPQTAGVLAKQVLVFDDLARWRAADLSILLKHIDAKTLVIALSNAKSETKEAFSGVMSPQKWSEILKKINQLPTGKVQDIDISQRAIIQIAQQLIECKKCKGTSV